MPLAERSMALQTTPPSIGWLNLAWPLKPPKLSIISLGVSEYSVSSKRYSAISVGQETASLLLPSKLLPEF